MADLQSDMGRISQATILHIEDDPAGRYAIGRVLHHEGFTVREAPTGLEGLRLLKEGPDLVILDVQLPDLSGFEVCRRIKADPATATIPVLHLSASYVTDEDQVTGLTGGADGYLVQPVDPDVLVATVKALLRMRRAEEKYRSIFENAVEGIFQATIEGRLLTANPALAHMFGYGSPEEMMTAISALGDCLYADPAQRKEAMRLLQEHATVTGFEALGRCKDGSRIWLSINARTIRDYNGRAVGFEGTVENITERKWAEKEIETRTHQQAVVAELGLRALAENDLSILMDGAVTLVAQTLNVEYCQVLQLLPDGQELLLRAGVGWKQGLVGNATIKTDLGSQAGYTLLCSEPVIVENLRTEARFRASPHLHEHGVVSGMSVVIHGRERPFGVLGAHTKNRRTFTTDDANFLQTVANVLTTAIERKEAEEKLNEVREAERQRMARDLHDQAFRDVSYALVEAQHIQAISKDSEPAHRLGLLVAALKRAGQELRGAIYDLRLGGEQDRPFSELLEPLVELHREMAPDCDIRLDVQDGFLSASLGERGTELLRIVGEALTNARRHSGARNVQVATGASEDKLWAEISDDGRGFDPAKELCVTKGMGIRGMHERTRSMGGDLKIQSEPGKGTRVRFELALKKEREEPEEEVRVLLVEDHVAVREALASTFEREAGFDVVGHAASLAEARRMLEGVDVAVVDLALPDGYGGDLTKELRAANPKAQALILSANVDRAEIARAVEAGAAGVLHKTALLEEVVEAVRRLRRGETLLPLEEVVQLLRFASSRKEEEYEARQAIARLTSREKEVLRALAEGFDSKEIAERLHISFKTEANHMTSILNKLGMHSRLQALVFALRHGVVEIH
jgi:PAS domain S-box-containing protein